jgi:dihydrolipoamide dehydrogenase
VVTGPFGATSVSSIYAIGDVAGPPMLAHKASHEAILCVEFLKGLKPKPMDPLTIPGCTYCHPQVASVGLTENRAKELGYEIRVGKFPLLANGKALALGEPEGFIKTLFDAKTGRLLGMHMIGSGVSELIHSAVVAMNLETTEEELIHSIFPHPTLSEAFHESVLSAYGRPLHYG